MEYKNATTELIIEKLSEIVKWTATDTPHLIGKKPVSFYEERKRIALVYKIRPLYRDIKEYDMSKTSDKLVICAIIDNIIDAYTGPNPIQTIEHDEKTEG